MDTWKVLNPEQTKELSALRTKFVHFSAKHDWLSCFFSPFILVLKPVFQECLYVSVDLEKPTGISIVSLILGHLSAAVVREVYCLLFSVKFWPILS